MPHTPLVSPEGSPTDFDVSPAFAAEDTEPIDRVIQAWQTALLGLHANNPLLCLPEGGTVAVGTVHAFSEVFRLLIHRAKPVTLWNTSSPAFDKSVLTQTGNYAARPAALQILRHLNAQADALLLSQDVNLLFVGFGTLTWQDEKAQTYRSPLLLLPITLRRVEKGNGYVIQRMEQEVEVNPLLRHRLAQEKAASVLPALPEEAYLVASAYLSEVAALVEGRDGWSMQETCFLGGFPLLKMRLYEDIAQQEAQARNHPLVRALVQNELGTTPDLAGMPPFAGEVIDEGVGDGEINPFEFQLLDADPAQEKAIRAAARGESFVLHGPPGTGKTQTITNIVGQCLALGKSVLLVSGRMASLDAVQQRLRRRGLGNLCLSAHSISTSRRDILHQLGQSLKPLAATTDSAPLITMSDSERKTLEQLRGELDAVAKELHQVRLPLGISLYNAHGYLAENEGVAGQQPPLSFDANRLAFFHWETLQNQEAAVARIAGHPLRSRLHDVSLWRGAFAAGQAGLPDLPTRVQLVLDNALAALHDLSNETETLSRVCRLSSVWETRKSVARFLPVWRTLSVVSPTGLRLLQTYGKRDDFQTAINALREKAQNLSVRAKALQAEKQRLSSCFVCDVFQMPPHEPTELARRLRHEGEAVLPALLGSNWRDASVANGPVLCGALQALQTACLGLHEEGTLLAEACGVSPDKRADVAKMGGSLPTLAQIANQAARFSFPFAGWLVSQTALVQRKKLLSEAESRWAILQGLREPLLQDYEKEIVTLDHAALRDSLGGKSAQTHWLLSTPAQLRTRRILQALLKPGVLLKERDLGEDLETAARVQTGEKWFTENAQSLHEAFESFYSDDKTDWDGLRQQITAAEALCELVSRSGLTARTEENGLPLFLILQVADQTGARQTVLQTKSEKVLGLLSSASDAWKQLTRLVSDTDGGTLPPAFLPFAELADWCATLLQAVHARNAAWEDALRLRLLLPLSDTATAALAAEWDAVSAFVAARDLFEADAARFASEATLDEPAAALGNHDWEAVCAALEQAQNAHQRLAASPDFAPLLSVLSAGGDDVRRDIKENTALVEKALTKADAAFVRLEDVFAPSFLKISGLPLGDASFQTAQSWLQTHRKNAEQIESTQEVLGLWNECDAAGLTEFFMRPALSPLLPTETVLAAFRAAFFRSWVEAVQNTVPVLKNFTAAAHEKKNERFCQLDCKLHEAASGKIKQAVKSRINKQAMRDEISVLTAQLARRRTGEVRGLLAQIPHLLLALKPCVMMNPLSVRRYLDPQAISFDVVLFDDASQIATEEAIGAILRGKQVIIAGDQQQLPPLPLMEAVFENKESILDAASLLAARGLPGFTRHTLNWHYRSMNESLIAYSRRYFYPDLISFPSATTTGAVEVIGLPNDDAEGAGVIVDAAFDYAARQPNHSIGIVAMDEAQQQAILSEIARRKPSGSDEKDALPLPDESYEENDAEAFFVKTIENVQGDERDMVLLCIPSDPARWDALNQLGGDRLLNVAATRARRRMIVATAVSSDDIAFSGDNEGSLAPAILKPFLETMEQEVKPMGEVQNHSKPGVESQITLALTHRGYQVHECVGLGHHKVDLAIVDDNTPGRYLLGITCDGASYASAQTARQRDRQRPQMLRERGWNLLPVWSAAWNAEPKKQLERIEAAIAQARTNALPAA